MIGKTRIRGEIRVLPTDAEVFSCFSSASPHTQDVVISNGVKCARLIFTPSSTFTVTKSIQTSRLIVQGDGGDGGLGYFDSQQGVETIGYGGYAGQEIRVTGVDTCLLSGSYAIAYTGSGLRLKRASTVIAAANKGGNYSDGSSSVYDGDNGYTDNVSGVKAGDGEFMDADGNSGIWGIGGSGYGAGGGGARSLKDGWEIIGGKGATGAVIIMVEVR